MFRLFACGVTGASCTAQGNVDPRLINPVLFRALTFRIPMIIPIKGKGFINQGSKLNPKP